MTRFVSLLLAVLMLLTVCPFVAAADGGFVLSVVNFDADLAADAAENLERMLPYAEEAMQSGASLVLVATYIPLMADFFAVLFRKESGTKEE